MSMEYRPARLVLSDIIDAKRRLNQLASCGWTSADHEFFRYGERAYLYEVERRADAIDWILGEEQAASGHEKP